MHAPVNAARHAQRCVAGLRNVLYLRSVPWRTCAFSFLLLAVLSQLQTGHAYQFEFRAGRKHCFYEEIPPNTQVLVSYTVVSGAGYLPVTLQVSHRATRSVIFARDSIESGKFTFRTHPDPNREDEDDDQHPHAHHSAPLPNANPSRSKQARNQNDPNGWQVREPGHDAGHADYIDSKVVDVNAEGLAVDGPQGLDKTDLFSFCFGKTQQDGSGLFHVFSHIGLSNTENMASRRVIFDIRYGAEAEAIADIDGLAKETHLSESEKLFDAINHHVIQVKDNIDSMRRRARRMEKMTNKTTNIVRTYSIAACLTILIGAVVTSMSTQATLKQKKLI